MGLSASSGRAARVCLLLLLLAGCGALPRSGPMAVDIDPPPGETEALSGLVAPLTAEAARLSRRPQPAGFPAAFLDAPPMAPDVLGPGDVLEITVWEGAEGGLFSPGGGGVALPKARVDAQGGIFVPFAGEVRAAGNTPAELRRRLRDALAPLTLSPQVSVSVVEANSRSVTVQGAVGAPGVYPVERPVDRLLPMLAAAGGLDGAPGLIRVALRRDGVEGVEPAARLFADPARDVALRPGDTIVASRSEATFTVLGATGLQAATPFPTEPLDLLSAIGAARGLRDLDADPSAVFLFRHEDEAVADALLPGPRPAGLPERPGRPIVYRLDLSDPAAFFIARAFEMRDGDALYVSNAPLTELRKFLQLFSTVLAPVQDAGALAPIQP
jgi:polysaccharide export outer membrane protein